MTKQTWIKILCFVLLFSGLFLYFSISHTKKQDCTKEGIQRIRGTQLDTISSPEESFTYEYKNYQCYLIHSDGMSSETIKVNLKTGYPEKEMHLK